jgi:hypothetical protein
MRSMSAGQRRALNVLILVASLAGVAFGAWAWSAIG